MTAMTLVPPATLPAMPVVEGLDLVVIDPARGGLEALTARLRDEGAWVRSLTVRPAGEGLLDLGDVDFGASMPHLRTLRVARSRVNGSVFAHPSLTRLSLDRVEYTGPGDVVLADGIEWLRIEGSSVPASSFTVGKRSSLRAFRWDQVWDQDVWNAPAFTPRAARAEGPRLLHLVSSN
ncbi:MAG TPA: hypothetical protein VGF17_03165 [Phytomonospora sp.]